MPKEYLFRRQVAFHYHVMANTILVLLTLLCITFQSQAQSVMATTSGEGMVGSTQISYTVGESFVTTIANDSTLVTQGFHQPYYYTVTAMEESLPSGTVTVFPNPTSSVLNVQFEDTHLEKYSLSLYDLSGRRILSEKIKTGLWQTDLFNLSNSLYILTVTDLKNNKTNSFKIFKSN